ncbi:MAG: hypothetical protein IJZ81_03785 [Clostridia bacterium]|nr:hypothetical protein [Clostridia bacterium]
MHNDQLEERIRARAEMETLKNEIRQKETEVREMASKMCLSDFSTTQLKAEIRRRKRERQGYM